MALRSNTRIANEAWEALFRAHGRHVGGINRFFQNAYKLRLQAKKLKATHRRTYYVSKWVAILGGLYLIFFGWML